MPEWPRSLKSKSTLSQPCQPCQSRSPADSRWWLVRVWIPPLHTLPQFPLFPLFQVLAAPVPDDLQASPRGFRPRRPPSQAQHRSYSQKPDGQPDGLPRQPAKGAHPSFHPFQNQFPSYDRVRSSATLRPRIPSPGKPGKKNSPQTGKKNAPGTSLRRISGINPEGNRPPAGSPQKNQSPQGKKIRPGNAA